ncbi:hypothetical protein HYV44_01420 [Candidatus Microgenomates bacterium]|nr:hypothetical protein [Candidatus Microgenomates bacterium]
MPYSVKSKKSGKDYFLHSKEVTLKGSKGTKQRIYWFSGKDKIDPKCALNDLPGGYKVVENPRTGLPMLKKG